MATGLTLEGYLKNDSSVKAARKKLDAADKKLKAARAASNSSRYASEDTITDLKAKLSLAQSEYNTAKDAASEIETQATDYFKKNYQEITTSSAKSSLGKLQTALSNAKSKIEADAIQKSIDEAKATIASPQLYKEPVIKKGKTKTGGIGGTDDTGEIDLITQTNAALAEKAKQENATNYLYSLSGPERLAWAKKLKAAKYNVPETGEYNSSLVDAYISALGDAQNENTFNKSVKGYIPNTLESYLNYKTNLVNTGDQLPETTGVQQVYDKSTAEGVIDNLFQTFLKRDASQAEINSLYKQLDAEQKKASSISKTKYKMVNGVKVKVEEINFDPKVFLENKIKELPTYKESLAAKSEQNKLSLAATALANGYNLESDFGTQLPSWLDAINKGESISKFQSTIRKNARNALPEAVKNSIDPNEDLSTAFSTYISNYSKTFGVPASQVSLSKIIPMATNEKGFVPIYDFEKKKRQLAEWDYTQDARTETANVVSTVLKDFGFKG